MTVYESFLAQFEEHRGRAIYDYKVIGPNALNDQMEVYVRIKWTKSSAWERWVFTLGSWTKTDMR